MVEQGDILKIKGLKYKVLVVSKNLFNESGHAIVCPLITYESTATLSYRIDDDTYVLCDNMRQLDLSTKNYSVKGRLSLGHMIHIIDRIQSLFDYY